MRDSIGEYRLLEELGEGAAGKVYLGTPTKTKAFAKPGEPVAIKVYNEKILKEPNELKRIEREFRVGSTLGHPNIVRMHDFQISPEPFLVMEYFDGMTLYQLGNLFQSQSHS